ncbi:serine/threonine-protein kinase [Actinomadura miaoliensis]|uniref:Serine/threonine-protein kinase n=1 Tax=Actinomadura miaoliensis TaxID=430685 RepID=A0ABP7WTA1_9ACTN
MMPLQPGDPRQVGPYRLERRLGGGGMGQVFLGRSPGGRPVAVKVVRPELAGDAAFRRRFAMEGEAARRVGGFYTAQVVDADPHADPPWLVTAFVPGPSLLQAVQEDGPLPARTLGVLGAGLAEGLAAIHRAGLVHRDLKPGNIILAADGPRVIDFGIVRALDAAHTSTAVLGTPGFMSPEQARGLDVGPPSDVFALGSVLTFAATGSGPFGTGSAEAIVYRIVHQEPDLTGLPAHLAGLVRACLAKDPEQRPRLAQILDSLAAVPSAPSDSGGWLPPTVTALISQYDRDFTDRPHDTADTALTTRADRRRRPSRRGFLLAGLGGAAGVPVVALLRSLPARAGGSRTPEPGRTRASLRPGAPVTLFEGDGIVRSMAFSPKGDLLAAVGDDGKARLWTVDGRRLAKTFTHKVTNPWNTSLDRVTSFNPQFGTTFSTAFTPDGSGLVVGNGDGTIDLWNIATAAVTTLPSPKPELWNSATGCVAVNPKDGAVAFSYDAPIVRVWDPAARAVRATLTSGDGYWVQAMAYGPSGDVLATASGNGNPGNKAGDGLLHLWDTSTHGQIATLARTNSDVQSLAFARDGRTLANLRNDGLITLWNVPSRERAATLAGPGSGVTCIAFGPNGLLAGGFNDGTVTLWDVTAGKSVTVLSTGANTEIRCVAFSPDGGTITAGGRKLTLWTLG